MSSMLYLISKNDGSLPRSDLKCFVLFDYFDEKVVEKVPLLGTLLRTPLCYSGYSGGKFGKFELSCKVTYY